MRRFSISGTTALILVVMTATWGNTSNGTGPNGSGEARKFTQEAQKSSPTPGGSSKKAVSLTGCIAKSDGENEFVLTNSEQKVKIRSTKRLADYVGHNVRLEGKWEKLRSAEDAGTEGGTKGMVFKATAITQVSESCDTSK